MRFGLGRVRPGLLTSSDEPYPGHGFDIAEHRFMKHRPDARAGQEGPASLRDHEPLAVAASANGLVNPTVGAGSPRRHGGCAARFARLHCRAVRIRYLAVAAGSDMS